MKYDDASWHYGGNFPEDLEPTAGATHIALFVAWATLAGLGGELAADQLPLLKSRSMTPTEWFIAACDEKFTDEDLSDEGNAFARSYYADAEGALRDHIGSYLGDYEVTFPEATDLYRVAPLWSSFDRLAAVLDQRLAEWRSRR
jgi:hypothetical protein